MDKDGGQDQQRDSDDADDRDRLLKGGSLGQRSHADVVVETVDLAHIAFQMVEVGLNRQPAGILGAFRVNCQ